LNQRGKDLLEFEEGFVDFDATRFGKGAVITGYDEATFLQDAQRGEVILSYG